MRWTICVLLIVLSASAKEVSYSADGRKVVYELNAKLMLSSLEEMGIDGKAFTFTNSSSQKLLLDKLVYDAEAVVTAIKQAQELPNKKEAKTINEYLKHLMKAVAAFDVFVRKTPIEPPVSLKAKGGSTKSARPK